MITRRHGRYFQYKSIAGQIESDTKVSFIVNWPEGATIPGLEQLRTSIKELLKLEYMTEGKLSSLPKRDGIKLTAELADVLKYVHEGDQK